MLTGVGLGPGDPGLLTLRAVEALEGCDVAFVPGRLAGELVEPYCDAVELDFPMTRDGEALEEAWGRNSRAVGERALVEDVCFPVLGDPNVLSTFNHLRRRVEELYPEVEVATVPGVSAVTALLSETGRYIEGSFMVTDGSPVRDVVAVKVVRPRERGERLREEGFGDFVLVSRMGMDADEVAEKLPEESHYFTMLHGRRDGGDGDD
ncbi:MAG: hypothetical protein MAG715_01309 [Methanonatronarchaeales archaeon]|nr:hypothetical protein [Methanonatronarchaeales archaeon]